MGLIQLSQWLYFSILYLAAAVFDLFPHIKKKLKKNLKARSLKFWREGYVPTLPLWNLTQTNALRDTAPPYFCLILSFASNNYFATEKSENCQNLFLLWLIERFTNRSFSSTKNTAQEEPNHYICCSCKFKKKNMIKQSMEGCKLFGVFFPSS